MRLRFYCLYLLCFVFLWAGIGSAQQEQAAQAQTDPNSVESPADEETNPAPPCDPNQPANSDEGEESDPFLDPKTDSEISEYRVPVFNRTCDELFSSYVTEGNLVKYSDLRRHRRKLYYVYRYLDEVHPAHLMALNREEKIAFWINAYNVCTLKLIVDNYPIKPKFYMIFYPDDSIMQISNAWTKQYFDIMGLEYTLNEIQHELLLERFKDPRICFALSYASLGGGRMRRDAYRPETLDEQLDEQTRQYLASQYGYRLEKSTQTIHLSNLFSSHRQVFLDSEYVSIRKFRNYPDHERAWLNFLLPYLSAEDVEFIENNPCRFQMMRFDWGLDEAK